MGDSRSIVPKSAGEHQGAPLPSNEDSRLEFVRGLNILDTVAEEAFDVITLRLTDIFNVPIALVSIVEESRQWFKSVVGLRVTETARSLSFCAHLLLPDDPEILLVPNATQDPRFCNNSLVTGDPFIRFYCGAPIVIGEHRLGSVCIIDRVHRYNIS